MNQAKTNPELQEAIKKATKLFEDSLLSDQICIKLWAAACLMKSEPEKFPDTLIRDIVLKSHAALKLAHTVELLKIILKMLEKGESELSRLSGEDATSAIGALLEETHNEAAIRCKPTLAQLDNLFTANMDDVKTPPQATSESHPA